MPDKRPFHLATHQEIKSGEVTDVYFNRTVQILRARDNRARVKAEVYLKSLPGDWGWGIIAGIEEAAQQNGYAVLVGGIALVTWSGAHAIAWALAR